MTTFEFDRQSQHLAASLLPRWSFQNAARVHANPEQMAKVFKSLEGLRFQSVSVCIARIGNNIALLISLWRLAKLLRGQVFPEFVGDTGANPKRSTYPRKHPLALLLVALAVATIAFVTISVYRSNKACELYPMCTMHAYRWGLSSKTSDTGNAENLDNGWNCPCRVLVDADLTPTTFSAWKNPPDATAHVSTLAASGDLEILQLINRRLPELPDTLRRCTHLKHMYVDVSKGDSPILSLPNHYFLFAPEP
ncbi:unnamed protein product [Phytophthora lilii]|uniref:Unnamed protein product n=1 Tax=Phytophthora lilii TaxID=2077276 RepID=A0A9W6T8W7_9STRA|nr:unnamed protein product [Phytophthora lilii]